MHETVMWHVSRARNYANEREPLNQRAAEHHDAIVDALEKKDPEGAARAMRDHLAEVIANIRERVTTPSANERGRQVGTAA